MTAATHKELEHLEEALDRGAIAAASVIVSRLENEQPDELHVAVARARLLAAEGHLEEALGRLETLVKKHKTSGLPRAYKGALLSLRGQHKKAVKEIEAARKKEGGEAPVALHALGASLLSLGRVQEALPVLEQAAVAMPRSASTLFHLGQAFEAMGDLEQAQLAFGRSVEVEPGYEGALASLVRVQALAGHLELAQQTVTEGLRRDPDDVELLRFRVQVCFDQEDMAGAMGALLAIPDERRDLEDLANLALLAVQAGEVDAAEAYARQAVAMGGDDWRPYWLLGLALEGKEPFPRDDVIEAYEAAIALGDPAAEAGARLGLALLFGDEVMTDIAAAVLEDARERNPEHPGVMLHLALARANQGEREEALELASAVLHSALAGEQERDQAARLLETLASG